MDWAAIEDGQAGAVLEHWQKLGRFRRAHPAVGAGEHMQLQGDPFIFGRVLEAGGISDRVMVAMGQGEEEKVIPVFGAFPDGTELLDEYSGQTGMVVDGQVTLTTPFGLVLLSERE